MNKGNTKRKYLAWHILVLVWMVVIFMFSAQQGEASSDISGSVTHVLVTLVNRIFTIGWDEIKVLEIAGMIEYPIRKLAHMTEFGILSLLVFGATDAYQKVRDTKWCYVIAFGVTFLYAGTDEIHQLFVPNRYGCFTDVLIDALGAVIALLMLAGILALLKKFKNKKRIKE